MCGAENVKVVKVSKIQLSEMYLSTVVYSKYVQKHVSSEVVFLYCQKSKGQSEKMSKQWRVEIFTNYIRLGKEKCNWIQPRIENEIPNRVI